MYDSKTNSGGFHYIDESSKMLEELLKTGTKTQLRKFTQDVFDDFEMKNPSNGERSFLAFSLFSAILRAASDKKTTNELYHEIRSLSSFSEFNADKIGGELSQICLKAKDKISINRKNSAYLIFEDASEIIENEFSNEELSLISVSKRLHVSPNYLSAVFKKASGTSFSKALTKKRMDTALDLILGTNMKILEISDICGFSDRHYFSRCFKKYFGISPKQVREKNSL